MKIFFSCLVFFALAALPLPALAQNPAPEKLAHEMGERMMRVPEFEFIRAEAEKLGVRVYLFGGTAAAYGHYVRQDLAREAGDKRYPKDLYDYDYTNIFRSTQDLDVVVDGSAEQATQLESILKSKFPHFIGDKSAGWEVRPLREARGEKEAILDNPNFLNQHTDSHSTGMVEITKTPASESPVKDVRDWGSKKPQFLKDVAEQRLHYYFNPLHGETDRAAKGLNPPILSVIRYLTKAFQYDLEISGEDKRKIQKIVSAFKPEDVDNDYLKRWVEKNGKKLFQHSVNLEYSWNTLDDLGLREKLARIKSDPREINSLAWWMNKEPLRSDAVGKGSGKTAAEIASELGEKELMLAHETNGYLAYESLTRSKAGDLNALISRTNAAGEAALHGEGFYTKIGRQGAKGTGFTIRMVLDPKAREGTDFIQAGEGGEYIVLKNKAAVKVIPEQINISLPEYLKLLASGKEFSSDDRALLESLKRRIGRMGMTSPQEEQEIYKLAKKRIRSTKKFDAFWMEYFSLPLSKKAPEIVTALLQNGKVDEGIAKYVLSQPQWQDHPEFVETLIKKGFFDNYFSNGGFAYPHWKDHPEFVQALIDRGKSHVYLTTHVFSQPYWADHPELLASFIKNSAADKSIAIEVLSQPHWQNHPEFVEELLKKGLADQEIVQHLLSQPHWKDHPEWVAALMESGKYDRLIVRYVLSQPHWRDREKWLETILKRGEVDGDIAEYILSQPFWKDKPEWVETLVKNGKADVELAKYVLSQPQWKDHPEWVDALLKNGKADKELVQYALSQPHWQGHPEWVEALIKSGNHDTEIAQYLLSEPHWQGHPEWVERLMNRGRVDKLIVEYILSQPHWKDHPEWVERLIKKGGIDREIIFHVLSQSHWASHPEWVEAFLKKKNPDLDVFLAMRVLPKAHWADHPEWLETLIRRGYSDSILDLEVFSQPHWQNHPILKAAVGKKPVTLDNLIEAFNRGVTFKPAKKVLTTCRQAFAALAP